MPLGLCCVTCVCGICGVQRALCGSAWVRVMCGIYAGDCVSAVMVGWNSVIQKSVIIYAICGSLEQLGLFTWEAQCFWEIGIEFAFGWFNTTIFHNNPLNPTNPCQLSPFLQNLAPPNGGCTRKRPCQQDHHVHTQCGGRGVSGYHTKKLFIT